MSHCSTQLRAPDNLARERSSAAERLKVLFLTAWYPSADYPMGGNFVRECARAVQLYDDVTVIHTGTTNTGRPSSNCLHAINQEDLTRGVRSFEATMPSVSIKGAKSLAYYRSVYRAFGEYCKQYGKPDVIHAHIYTAGLAASLLGKWYRIPSVISEHWSGFPRRLLRRSDVMKARLALRWADVVLPVSRALQRSIEAYNIRANFRVVPNVVDTDLFSFARRDRQPDGQVRLLFVGSLDDNKGLPHLLRALASLEMPHVPWVLDVVGGGPKHQEYAALAMELGIAPGVTFHGSCTKERVADFMHRSDVFVLASLHETFSVATAEALAAGLPVLATRCGGPEDIVDQDAGLLVPPGDPAALAAGLRQMIEALETYDRSLISARARQRYSPESIGSRLHGIYSEVRKIPTN